MKPDLKAIAERAEKATVGPWVGFNGDGPFSGEIRSVAEELNFYDLIVKLDDLDDRPDDIEFIAHAREDIPALLDYIADLETVAGAAREHFKLSGCETINCTYCTASNCGHKEFGKEITKLDGDKK